MRRRLQQNKTTIIRRSRRPNSFTPHERLIKLVVALTVVMSQITTLMYVVLL